MKSKAIIISFFIVGIVVFTQNGFAYENVLGLEGKQYYDIYIGSSDDVLSVIRNVEIIELREIAGMTFLIIQTDSFASKRSRGLITFNAIKAVLPTHKTTPLQGASQIRY